MVGAVLAQRGGVRVRERKFCFLGLERGERKELCKSGHRSVSFARRGVSVEGCRDGGTRVCYRPDRVGWRVYSKVSESDLTHTFGHQGYPTAGRSDYLGPSLRSVFRYGTPVITS